MKERRGRERERKMRGEKKTTKIRKSKQENKQNFSTAQPQTYKENKKEGKKKKENENRTSLTVTQGTETRQYTSRTRHSLFILTRSTADVGCNEDTDG